MVPLPQADVRMRAVGDPGQGRPRLPLAAGAEVQHLVGREVPRLVLVDELAHTNAPGSRHPKRYQDVEELLAAGHSGAEYDAWMIQIGNGDQFGVEFAAEDARLGIALRAGQGAAAANSRSSAARKIAAARSNASSECDSSRAGWTWSWGSHSESVTAAASTAGLFAPWLSAIAAR